MDGLSASHDRRGNSRRAIHAHEMVTSIARVSSPLLSNTYTLIFTADRHRLLVSAPSSTSHRQPLIVNLSPPLDHHGNLFVTVLCSLLVYSQLMQETAKLASTMQMEIKDIKTEIEEIKKEIKNVKTSLTGLDSAGKNPPIATHSYPWLF